MKKLVLVCKKKGSPKGTMRTKDNPLNFGALEYFMHRDGYTYRLKFV